MFNGQWAADVKEGRKVKELIVVCWLKTSLRHPSHVRLRGYSWLERHLTIVQFMSSQKSKSLNLDDNGRRNPGISVRRRVTLHYVLTFRSVHSNVPMVGKSSRIGVLQLPKAVPVQFTEGTGQEGEFRTAEPVGAL